MTEWQQKSLFPNSPGFQWQFKLTLAPDRDDLILEKVVMGLPDWRQLAHAVDYKHRTPNGVRAAVVDMWDAVKDVEDYHGLILPVFENWDPGPPF